MLNLSIAAAHNKVDQIALLNYCAKQLKLTKKQRSNFYFDDACLVYISKTILQHALVRTDVTVQQMCNVIKRYV